MPIEELEEPIWEKQKGETPNQYCYFQEFLQFPTFNLKDFHKHICETYQNLPTSAAKPPKYNTIKGWSADNKWTDRKNKKRMDEKQDMLNTLHELDKADKIEKFKLKKEINSILLKRILEQAEFEKFSQLKHGVDAYKGLEDDNRVDREEPTNYTKTDGTFEVETETTIKNPGLNRIAEAYINGRQQHQQE